MFQTGLTDFSRIGDLPIEAHYPHPPNFGARTTPFGRHGVTLRSNPFHSEPRRVKKPQTTTPFSPPIRKYKSRQPKPDKIVYESEKAIEKNQKPKFYQHISFGRPDSVSITQKITSKPSRAPAELRKSSKRSPEHHKAPYQPPVYRPRPSKAADPYKVGDKHQNYKQPDNSYSPEPFTEHYNSHVSDHHEYKPSNSYKPPKQSYKPHKQSYKPPKVSYKPPKQAYKPPKESYKPVHDTYKPSKPSFSGYDSSGDVHDKFHHDSYKPSKPIQESYRPKPKRKPHVQPKLLQPVYAPAEKSKQFHKSQKPLYDPYKPLDDKYFHHEEPYKKSSIPGIAGVDYPIFNEVR